jgi:hypothetical protein
MMTIKAEQEHYCLLTDGGSSWTVIERRAGKYYPLGNCSRPGVALDEPGARSTLPRGTVLSRAGRTPSVVGRGHGVA